MATKNKKQMEFVSKFSGEKYIFQKVSPAAWLDIMDEVNAEKRSRKLYDLTLENIVVQPKKTVDDFEDFAELDEVVTAALRFQRGK
jgi:hypothetical protein